MSGEVDIVERLRKNAKWCADRGRDNMAEARIGIWQPLQLAFAKAADEIESLRTGRDGALREAAAIANEAAQHEREEIVEIRRALGKAYDHNSYGAGYENGSLATAENIAEAITALLSPPQGEDE